MPHFPNQRPLAEWAPAEVAADVEIALVSDPEDVYLRVAVVVRSEPDRLPPREAAAWADGFDQETEGRGLPPYFIYTFQGSDEDPGSTRLQGENYARLIREVAFAFDRDGAVQIARDWTGEQAMVALSPAYIPGVYLAGLIEFVTGVPRAWEGYLMGHWCWVGEAGDTVARARPYPPGGMDGPSPTNEQQAEGEISGDAVALIPTRMVDVEFSRLLASPPSAGFQDGEWT